MKTRLILPCLLLAGLAGCADDGPPDFNLHDEFGMRDRDGDRLSPEYAEGIVFTLRVVPREADVTGWSVRSETPALLEVVASKPGDQGEVEVELRTLALGDARIAVVDDAGKVRRSEPIRIVGATPRVRVADHWDSEAMQDELRVVMGRTVIVFVEYVDARGGTVAGATITGVTLASGDQMFAGSRGVWVTAARERDTVTLALAGGREKTFVVIGVEPTAVATIMLDDPGRAGAAEGARVCATLIVRDAEAHRVWGADAMWSIAPESSGDRVCYDYTTESSGWPYTVTVGNQTLTGVLPASSVEVSGGPLSFGCTSAPGRRVGSGLVVVALGLALALSRMRAVRRRQG